MLELRESGTGGCDSPDTRGAGVSEEEGADVSSAAARRDRFLIGWSFRLLARSIERSLELPRPGKVCSRPSAEEVPRSDDLPPIALKRLAAEKAAGVGAATGAGVGVATEAVRDCARIDCRNLDGGDDRGVCAGVGRDVAERVENPAMKEEEEEEAAGWPPVDGGGAAKSETRLGWSPLMPTMVGEVARLLIASGGDGTLEVEMTGA